MRIVHEDEVQCFLCDEVRVDAPYDIWVLKKVYITIDDGMVYILKDPNNVDEERDLMIFPTSMVTISGAKMLKREENGVFVDWCRGEIREDISIDAKMARFRYAS